MSGLKRESAPSLHSVFQTSLDSAFRPVVRDPVTFADLRIRTKQRSVIPFVPNSTQIEYLRLLGWEEGKQMSELREIVLKGRQLGMSTLILALMFMDTVNHPNTSSVVVAHDADSTIELFSKIQVFYENLPDHKKPHNKYANRREFDWDEIGSRFFVGTAGSKDFGRSRTINNLHASEVPFWPDTAGNLMVGLLQAVPESGNVFMESTANGLGNYFHGEWVSATDGTGVFQPRFFEWYKNPEYVREVPDDFEPYEDEIALAQRYELSDQQLMFRRYKMREIKEKFPQEYPMSAEEAFLVSGSPYFHRDSLSEMLLECKVSDPIAVRDAIPERFDRLRKLVNAGKLVIYELPVAGEKYVVGADTAEGLDADGQHDFDSADVLSVSDWEQVAHLHGQWDTHEYGLILAELGEFYNMALVGVERNNHGHAVLNAMLHTANYPQQPQYGGSGVYYHEEYDEKKRLKARKPGWPTTPKTKFFALDGLATSVENFDIKINSRVTIGEMLTFVKLPGGKAGGEGKSHDDRVMSLAIADAVLKARPKESPMTTHDDLYEAFWGVPAGDFR